MRNTRTIPVLIMMFSLLSALGACSGSSGFSWNLENSGEAPETPDNPVNPFEPTVVPTVEGVDPTGGHDVFTQAYSTKVDIVWVIDDSGSMEDNQEAIANNAELFTQKLESASVDFKLIFLTSDPESPKPTYPEDGSRRSACQNKVITGANVDLFAECALVGTQGSGWEEGLESARRALDPAYPMGPFNSIEDADPILPGFLRSDADLQIVYVSDEEDQGDANPAGSNTWDGHVSAAQIEAYRMEMPTDTVVVADSGIPNGGLRDGGHCFADNDNDNRYCTDDTISRYAFFPLVENHVAFLEGLETGGRDVTAHAITIARLDGSDTTCHVRRGYEEIGQRYRAVADLMNGSKTDICNSWTSTMNEIGLQASGLNKCFALSHRGVVEASIEVEVDGLAVSGFEYSRHGNLVCLDEIPAVHSVIDITYDYF